MTVGVRIDLCLSSCSSMLPYSMRIGRLSSRMHLCMLYYRLNIMRLLLVEAKLELQVLTLSVYVFNRESQPESLLLTLLFDMINTSINYSIQFKEGPTTAKKCSPYHSVDSDVYHIYSDCTVGDNIERDKRKPGTGNKRLCPVCRDIQSGKRTR